MNKRRALLKQAAFIGLGAASGILKSFAAKTNRRSIFSNADLQCKNAIGEHLSIIGQYGEWAAGLTDNTMPALSFRGDEWKDIEKWRKVASRCMFLFCPTNLISLRY